jgi:hypothetical protein
MPNLTEANVTKMAICSFANSKSEQLKFVISHLHK